MAGKELYVAKMLECLQASISEVVESMATTTEELSNIKTAVSAQVTSMQVTKSDNVAAIPIDTAVSRTINNSTAVASCTFAKFKSAVTGSVRVRFTWSYTDTITSGGRGINAVIGGTTVIAVATASGKWSDKVNTYDFNVSEGDEVSFYFVSSASQNVTISISKLELLYDIVDLVNDGGLVPTA